MAFLYVFHKDHRPWELHMGGYRYLFKLRNISWSKPLRCEWDRREPEVADWVPQAKPIKSALQMCLFGSSGVSFLNIEISCQAAKTGNFYFKKKSEKKKFRYMTCLKKIRIVWLCWDPYFCIGSHQGSWGLFPFRWEQGLLGYHDTISGFRHSFGSPSWLWDRLWDWGLMAQWTIMKDAVFHI